VSQSCDLVILEREREREEEEEEEALPLWEENLWNEGGFLGFH
jgi:hypothetical protein